MGTPGDDTLFYFGTQQHVTLTLVNPYSGRSYYIDDDFYVSSAVYDGGAGNDTLFMTPLGEYVSLTDNIASNEVGNQILISIEVIRGGSGGDVINLASNSIIYGDILIYGDSGDDLIFGNAGDDTIYADGGNDTLEGGPGNDLLYGEGNSDIIYGGDGSDLLSGGSGSDVLHYSADATWPGGFVAWNVGDPTDIINGDRIVVNPRDRNFDGFDGGSGIDTIQMGDASDALFLDDRYSDNPFGFNTARIRDVEIIRAGDGHDIVDLTSKQFLYGDVSIYGDGGNDVLWGNAGNDHIEGGTGNDHLDGASGNDVLIGDAGNDKMFGRGGDDTLIFGDGIDQLYGGDGSDTFLMDVMDAGADHIHDFTTGVGGDVLDISSILQGYDALTDLLSDFVQLVDSNGDTCLKVNADGQQGAYITAVIFEGGISETLTDLVNDGNLIA